MKHVRLLVAGMAILVALVPLGAHPALAGTYTVSGTLDSSDPTLDAAIISNPNCTGAYAGFQVQYEAVSFTVTASGTYAFDEAASPSTAIYLYAGSFNPSAAANCIAASNVNPLHMTYALATGTTYFVVLINDTFSQAPLSYVLTISGPGDINVGGGGPGCEALINIPSTAVGATFVADAQVYWEPGQLTNPLVTLQAGKTVRAIGLDSTGQYRQILFQCQFLWVRAETLGPNYDAVWQGRPLPGGAVGSSVTSGGNASSAPAATSSGGLAGGAFPVNSAPVTASTYTVQRGDNLFRIARHFGVDLGKLASVNGISDPRLIYVGQVLNIAAAR